MQLRFKICLMRPTFASETNMRLRMTIALIAWLSLLTISGAHAATLFPFGKVAINTGNGFVDVRQTTSVDTGDVVMVSQGRAEITCNEVDEKGSIKDSPARHILETGRTYNVGEVCGNGLQSNNPQLQAQSFGNVIAPAASGLGVLGVGALVILRSDRTGSDIGRRPTSP